MGAKILQPPNPRTLDSEIPELKPFLKPGMKVLDVGCGTGTITLGVAEAVKPGTVMGIDPGSRAIETAREWAAQVKHPDNIAFKVGDSHRLDFPDGTFDMVYSHTVLHFFLDPVMGLKEQKRVTKKGGWVVASGVRDMTSLRYPPCPNWEKVYEAYRRYWNKNLERFHASGKDPVAFFEEHYRSAPSYMYYLDMHAGRKCPEWFHNAGLEDIQVMIQPRRMFIQSPKGMNPNDALDFMAPSVLEAKSDVQRQYMSDLKQLTERLLDEETVQRAIEEARAWYKDPWAFQFWPEVFAAGRVN